MKNITNLRKLNFKSTKTKQASHQLFSHTLTQKYSQRNEIYLCLNKKKNTIDMFHSYCSNPSCPECLLGNHTGQNIWSSR